MAFADTEIKVDNITDENIYLKKGPETFTIPKTEIESLMAGGDELTFIKHAVARNLSLSGVSNLTNNVLTKEVIESRKYKCCG